MVCRACRELSWLPVAQRIMLCTAVFVPLTSLSLSFVALTCNSSPDERFPHFGTRFHHNWDHNVFVDFLGRVWILFCLNRPFRNCLHYFVHSLTMATCTINMMNLCNTYTLSYNVIFTLVTCFCIYLTCKQPGIYFLEICVPSIKLIDCWLTGHFAS